MCDALSHESSASPARISWVYCTYITLVTLVTQDWKLCFTLMAFKWHFFLHYFYCKNNIQSQHLSLTNVCPFDYILITEDQDTLPNDEIFKWPVPSWDKRMFGLPILRQVQRKNTSAKYFVQPSSNETSCLKKTNTLPRFQSTLFTARDSGQGK